MPDTMIDPFAHPTCGICGRGKIPIIGTWCRICSNCDGWPPRLDPPAVPTKEEK